MLAVENIHNEFTEANTFFIGDTFSNFEKKTEPIQGFLVIPKVKKILE